MHPVSGKPTEWQKKLFLIVSESYCRILATQTRQHGLWKGTCLSLSEKTLFAENTRRYIIRTGVAITVAACAWICVQMCMTAQVLFC
jgi:hypothetical protein